MFTRVKQIAALIAFIALFSAENAATEPPRILAGPSYLPGAKDASTFVTQFQHLNGKRIRSVTIEVREVFDDPGIGALYRTANNLKVNTRPEIIERELLFKEGDAFDAYRVQESERVLRELRFLRKVDILPVADGDEVDLLVTAQDTWTLIPQLGYSSGTGRQRYSVGMVESNLGGLGKRAEILFEEEETRNTIETVWEDRRVMGSNKEFLLAYFDRSDGERVITSFGKPLRTLYDKASWQVFLDHGDTIGRLFYGGDERFIFRQKTSDFNLRYTISEGSPETTLQRYSFGYDYVDYRYSQANEDDYEDLNLDPDIVGNDLSEVPESRRFSGPKLVFEHLTPRYVSENYIDRFDRVEDYNLGLDYSLNLMYAPEALGSREEAILFSANLNRGYAFDRGEFIRGDIGVGSRYVASGLEDTILRAEARYYNVIGPLYLGGLYLGQHTFASSFFIDYGSDLDRNRQFLIGGDNALRGYEAKTFAGEKRYALNIEERIHIIEDLFRVVSVGSALFVEVGGATDSGLGDLFGADSYGDAGFGFRFAFPRSSGGSVVRVDFAVPFRDGPDGSSGMEVRVIFAGGQLFNSRLRSETYGPELASVAVGLDR